MNTNFRSPRHYIPNLDTLYAVTADFIKENQKEKGFIDTDYDRVDYIYGLYYDYGLDMYCEIHITGVRVNENDEIEIASFEYPQWEKLRYSDIVYYVPTLFNIAEFIEGYVE